MTSSSSASFFLLLFILQQLPRAGGLTTTPPPRYLLAVDIGSRRTGTALFDAAGRLRAFGSAELEDDNELQSYIASSIASAKGDGELSYLIVEGGDVSTISKWKVEGDQRVFIIKPETWREAILLPSERRNSQSCKQAARNIGRQIVERNKLHDESGGRDRMNTDAAEAICLGLFGSSAWIGGGGGTDVDIEAAMAMAHASQRTSACIPGTGRRIVERYSNGGVVI